jgi:hypothetical protein
VHLLARRRGIGRISARKIAPVDGLDADQLRQVSRIRQDLVARLCQQTRSILGEAHGDKSDGHAEANGWPHLPTVVHFDSAPAAITYLPLVAAAENQLPVSPVADGAGSENSEPE